jgi:hypothetical protein
VLYPLTDYKPRKAENLERGYLQGRYGAIPFLGDFHVSGEVVSSQGVRACEKIGGRGSGRLNG